MPAADVPMPPAAPLECKEFNEILAFIREGASKKRLSNYWVPSTLIGGTSANTLVNAGNPYGFYLHIMERIAEENLNGRGLAKAWALSEKDIVYQSFIRNFATLNGERGTALKQIGFLPFLRDRLGVTVFVSLPTGTVGSTSRKGSIGSPFAIKNPFDIDQSFSDPLLPDFSPLFQYKALVQACTMLGIAPGSIVPLATLAVDSPLFALFPDLGFWWVAEPGDILYSGSNPANPDCTRERRDTWRVADTPRYCEFI